MLVRILELHDISYQNMHESCLRHIINSFGVDIVTPLGQLINQVVAQLQSKRRFRCGEKLARAHGGLRRRRFAAESGSICARSGSEVFPGHFFFSSLCCCAFVFRMCWDTLCIQTGASKRCVSTVSALQFSCVVPFSLCRSQWNGCAKASRTVLVLQCCSCDPACLLQVTVVGSHWNCYHIMAGCSWIVGFAQTHCVFIRVNGGSVVGKELARAHGGLRRRRFAAESGSICARSGTEGSRWLFSLLCWCCAFVFLHVLRHFVHWNYNWNWLIRERCGSTVLCWRSTIMGP